MTGFGKRLDGPGGRRGTPRCSVFAAASIATLKNSRVAAVIDVSNTGAKLQGCGDVSLDQDVWLKIGSIDAFATVVWIADEMCGIAFDEPLSNQQVQQLSELAHWTIAGLSPEERLAAEDWINDFVR